LLVRTLARGTYDPTRLLLSGFAVSSILASATGLILVLAPAGQLLRGATYWLFGGLGTPTWSALVLPACLLIGAVAWMFAQAERLDRLNLGQDVAVSLGVDVPALRRGVLAVAVALTAVTVAACGLVGFVGLIAPHAARRLVGQPHRYLLPFSALGGALLVMSADTVARTAFAPREIPVGLVTAAIGGPFFLWQLQRDSA
jgi:iron complex transport system permease protein